jgi:hypothetical protein
LWRTDGTYQGTERLQDIAPGVANSHPSSFARVGASIFFTANDNVLGYELWAMSDYRANGLFLPVVRLN